MLLIVKAKFGAFRFQIFKTLLGYLNYVVIVLVGSGEIELHDHPKYSGDEILSIQSMIFKSKFMLFGI
jgi:hypothetical protein